MYTQLDMSTKTMKISAVWLIYVFFPAHTKYWKKMKNIIIWSWDIMNLALSTHNQ